VIENYETADHAELVKLKDVFDLYKGRFKGFRI